MRRRLWRDVGEALDAAFVAQVKADARRLWPERGSLGCLDWWYRLRYSDAFEVES